VDDQPHLALRGVGKWFGATRALDDVSVDISAGSVHAFVGENGAGKSTLGKIVAGVFPPDEGELILRGDRVAFRSPREALDRGIALVAQEVALVPQLTVAQNVYLGAEPRRAGFIDRGRLASAFARLGADSGFDLEAGATVGRLPIGKQQQVEILRALARDAELIVFDEPSASLSAKEVDRLHEIVRRLAASGRTVLLVSHFLPEVLALADTVTVLRDGRLVRTGSTADETEATLIAAMLGRSVGRAYPPKSLPAGDAPLALSVRELTAPGVKGVSLDVRAGEIVGLAGLIGAGRSELARAIYGAAPAEAQLVGTGDQSLGRSPAASLAAGVALIPESRKDEGLLLRRPVRENVSLTHLHALTRLGFVRRRAERAATVDALEHARAATNLADPAGRLSGGNQQKLLFARALMTRPRVLLADEPTRGVDVGAKRELYELLVSIAGGGVGILLISNEIEEILGLSHRVLVMRAGRVVAEFDHDHMTEEAILAAAFGTAQATAA
jgi:ABC-type sugar transport system ATPase subunit